jgi:hypothetical protein
MMAVDPSLSDMSYLFEAQTGASAEQEPEEKPSTMKHIEWPPPPGQDLFTSLRQQERDSDPFSVMRPRSAAKRRRT